MSNNKINTITPVSLSILKASGKLVENAESQIMMKDGPTLSTVCVFGQVKEIEQREGYRAILIDDGSGHYVVRDYKDKPLDIAQGQFMRAYGNVRQNKQGTGMHFTAFELRPIDKQHMAQMSVLMIESMNSQLKFTGGSVNNTASVTTTASVKTEAVNTGHSDLPLKDGITSDHNKVLAVVLKIDAEEGAKVPEDFSHLGINMDKVKTLLQSLADEGHIYSTVDDNHYKST